MFYTYSARKSPREQITGTLEAESEREAVLKLKRLGYFPIELRRQRSYSSSLMEMLAGRLSTRDLALLARQLGTLSGSGVGLSEALALVAGQVSGRRLAEVLADVRSRVEGGETLHDALAGHRRLFPPFLVSVVAAGEAGGMLAEVLDRTASHYESLEELRGKVWGALVYPAFLFVVGVIAVGILVTFVVPRFAELFAGLGQNLPMPTQVLLAVSAFMASYWAVILAGLFAVAIAFYQVGRTRAGRLTLDTLKLAVPFYGRLIEKIETARFARTLSSLLENGVPMLSALGVVAETLGNRKFGAEVLEVRDAVEKGSALGEALKKHTGFADMAFSMVKVGESSGTTPEMLEKIASVYQREVDRASRALTTLLEPLLILLMGGCVAFIVMSILLPVFRLEIIVQ